MLTVLANIHICYINVINTSTYLCMSKINLGNPYEQKYSAYVEKLGKKNLLDLKGDVEHYNDRRDSMRATLEDAGIEPNIGIATTGSDGRGEKKGDMTSPVEGVVLVELVPKYIREKLAKKYLLCGGRKGSRVEVKEMLQDTIAYLNNEIFPASHSGEGRIPRNIAWPTRIMDLYPLSEDSESLILQSKLTLGNALIARPNYGEGNFEGTRIRSDVNAKFMEYLRVMKRDGKAVFRGTEMEHYNAERGELYFNRKNDSIHVSSVKYGPLRSVQLFIALKIIDLIREKNDPTIMESVAHKIIDKLDILESCRVLTPQQAKDIYDLYQYFLWCYCISEYTYSYKKQTTAYIPDKQLFKENAENLINLLKK